jgi:hypothetical protein
MRCFLLALALLLGPAAWDSAEAGNACIKRCREVARACKARCKLRHDRYDPRHRCLQTREVHEHECRARCLGTPH